MKHCSLNKHRLIDINKQYQVSRTGSQDIHGRDNNLRERLQPKPRPNAVRSYHSNSAAITQSHI